MNAVIYARYSSAGQRDVSIEDQVREIQSYADYHKINITHTYADRAMTGRNDKRPQFQQMITDAKKGTFQAVLVYKFDRFSRNEYDSVVNKKKLSDAGVKLISVTEPIPDGHGAKILESIYRAMAEEYSENLSQNVRRGMTGNALKCLANHLPAFGYRINQATRKYEADPVTAPIVHEIFRMTIDGKPQKEILNYLKSIGYTRSVHWLYHVLRNERYIGYYIYDDIRIKDGMPRLISDADFQKVREIAAKRKHSPQAKPYAYLFSGIIFCGYCHKLMAGESARSHTGKTYRYYTCTEAKRNKKCQKQRISADFLESKAVEALKSTIFQDDVLTNLASDVYNYLNTHRIEYLKNLQKRLSDVEKSIANIITTIERFPAVPDSLLEHYTALEKEKNELAEKISSEQFAIDTTGITRDDLISTIRNFSHVDNKALVNTFVTRITVYNDYAILEYDASGDNSIRLDFVHDSVWRATMSTCTKYTIHNAVLYVKVQLAA